MKPLPIAMPSEDLCTFTIRIHASMDELPRHDTSPLLVALPEAKANGESWLETVRSHWSIENGNHYVRDRTY